jgi:hypothetical protein
MVKEDEMPWLDCTVVRAGPAENGVIYIALMPTDGSFTRWFQAVPSMEKEMLATALAAISGGKLVNVSLTDTAAYSTINRLYIIA